MNKWDGRTDYRRLEEAKETAGRMMHMHYCENDVEGIVSLFAPDILWMGAGEDEYIVGREACVKAFAQMKGSIPRCNIWDEEYDAIQPSEGIYLVTGRMWIATDPSTRMYLKAHQRVSFVFQEEGDRLLCAHIHCSNPYQEMMEGERFPEKIGRQSFDYVEERMKILEEEMRQKNRQMEVIMSSIAGGLKISNDDDTYSYAFVSREAAALDIRWMNSWKPPGGQRWATCTRLICRAHWLTVRRPLKTAALPILPVTGCAAGTVALSGLLTAARRPRMRTADGW